MAIESGFFNSLNRDRVYDARWFAQYFSSFIGNGVFPDPSTGLQVTAGNNLTTVVRAGKGWINGYFVVNDSDYILQHDISDGLLKRIDRIVVRLDYLSRAIDVYVKKGTFASNPVGPALQRDSEAYELSLADVLINNGDTQISQSRITDTRLNSNLCGIVKGVVNQIDTTNLFAQYDAAFNEFFNDIKDILDGDVAGNLANRISALENKSNDFEYQTPTVVGSQLRLVRNSNTRRLFIRLNANVNGSITISLDGGSTSKPLVDSSGQQVSSVQAGFAEVVEDTSFFILRSSGISAADLQALIDIVNEAERNESDLRTQFINEVNEVDVFGGINLPVNATWADVLAVVPNIKTGKVSASGNKNSSANQIVFSYPNSPNTSFNAYQLEVNGLSFNESPSTILILGNSNRVVTVYSKTLGGFSNGIASTGIIPLTGYQVTWDMAGINTGVFNGYSTENGFSLPVRLNGAYSWIAFE